MVGRTRNNKSYAWTGHKDVERAYNANTLNQYTRAGPATFTHEKNGSLAGETSSQGATSYTYDVENRLVQASGLNDATLRYDPLGRIFKAGAVTFLYDGDALIGEYNGAGAGTLAARYVHGAAEGVDDPLVWYDGSSKRWLHADHQGSVVAVTAPGGGALWINAYDEYGIPKSTNRGRFQYTGQAWIPALGMYHYKARIYSPTLGRFLQTDPIGYEGGMNLYGYVGNDPLNLVDPSRQIPGDPFATADDASVDWLNMYNPPSIANNVEYLGATYELNGRFYSTPGVEKDGDGGEAGFRIPLGSRRRDLHTHGYYSVIVGNRRVRSGPGRDDYDSNNPSPEDRMDAKHRGVPMMIGTPSGVYLKYDLKTHKTTRILPYKPKVTPVTPTRPKYQRPKTSDGSTCDGSRAGSCGT